MSEEEVDDGDEFGLNLLTCTDLRAELKSRGLPRSGLKSDLVLWMKICLESERDDVDAFYADGEEDGDTIVTTKVIPVLDGTL